jgi:hypothetical protein
MDTVKGETLTQQLQLSVRLSHKIIKYDCRVLKGTHRSYTYALILILLFLVGVWGKLAKQCFVYDSDNLQLLLMKTHLPHQKCWFSLIRRINGSMF